MGEAPHRVQLRRTKGWRMPKNTVSVARPTGYGNRFHVGLPANPTVADCVRRFREEQVAEYEGSPLERLRGKNLACWCPLDQPCHADVLLELANTPETCLLSSS
jgi:hypothetical protein